MKKLNVISTLIAAVLFVGAMTAQAFPEKTKSDNVIRKAYFLSLSQYAMFETLSLQFGVAPRGTRGFVYDNLQTTPPFEMRSFDEKMGVSFKNYSAAKKAVRFFEDKKREDGLKMVATVLYEKAEYAVSGQENPWAILLSRKSISGSGKMTLTPVIMYIIDRDSRGEKVTQVGQSFDGPLL